MSKLGLNESELKKFLLKKKEASDIDDQILLNKSSIEALYLQIKALEEKNDILIQRKAGLNEFANSLADNLFITNGKSTMIQEELAEGDIVEENRTGQLGCESVVHAEETKAVIEPEVATGEPIAEKEVAELAMTELPMTLPKTFKKNSSETISAINEEQKKSEPASFELWMAFPEWRGYNGLQGDPEFRKQFGDISKDEILRISLGMDLHK